MIQALADKYKKHIAYPLLTVLYLQVIIAPLHAAVNTSYNINTVYDFNKRPAKIRREKPVLESGNPANSSYDRENLKKEKIKLSSPVKASIGGPSSPEATSFKAVGSDNLVNLFTGNFSYSVPLLDVGGYPINLFYSGGVTMEQEASWVGLGWNLNPGTVSRNMRGVPDDFNGDDKLIQTQNVKPNRTWGGEVGVDGELLGIKRPNVNFSLGVSLNNYLGPALELGAGVSVTIPLQENVKSEKAATSSDSSALGGGITLGLGAKLNSRSGLTLAPSLNAKLSLNDNQANIGLGLSTSYNSRTGIKDINISSQTSYYKIQRSFAGSSTISFARPSYIPTLRMPMEYSNTSGQLEIGFGMAGARGAAQAQGYYSESKVPIELRTVNKPLVGFMYSEKANANKDAVMDFNRLNDAEVTPNTPILSAPQYAYDVFSIQGEGTGGTIRAYRGDLGYMRDNETVSKDKNFSLGFDIAPAGHFGGNWTIASTPTRVGGWEDANNTLRQTMAFKGNAISNSAEAVSFENVYFRNPGEVTISNPNLINRIGGDNLVRFKLSGSKVNPRLESVLEQFNKNTGTVRSALPISTANTNRDKRTQVTTMLTAAEAAQVGLEKDIRNYPGTFDAATNNIQSTSISRLFSFRKPHHISEINVLEQSGMRYVYGLPVYSIKQKDYTFSVANPVDPATGLVSFSADEPAINSRHMNNASKVDGYVMAQETPAFASSFLLTGLLSPDYVDVTGNGITEDDLGGAVKFDYNKSDSVHRWRTPRNSTAASAHFSEGLKSEKKDNKATISYGEREVWYLKAIESKSMVAIFKTSDRDDAKGVFSDLDGRINAAERANKRLDTIHLYTKAEIKQKGINSARPIKSVIFSYDYSLCNGTPDNRTGGGKLTLTSVHFSYNGQPRLSKNKYVFNYGTITDTLDNPKYASRASDKWGTYKNPNTNFSTNMAANPGGLNNADFPYTASNPSRKPINDSFAAAWSLKKILLPSGGQMEVQYEASDYAYVQDRRACDMQTLYGFGNTKNAVTDNGIYQPGLIASDNFYVYIKLPQALQSTDSTLARKEIFDKYLQSLNQLSFKLLINMPKGPEALTVYANYDYYGLCKNIAANDVIYIRLSAVDGKSPLSKSAIGFISENLPGQAFDGYEIEVGGIAAFLEMVGGLLVGLKNAFRNVDAQIRSVGRARTVILDQSFVRLTNPYKVKYGGGVRVKKVLVKDNWQKMLTGSGPVKGFTSMYGQEYDYTTTEKINGVDAVISSGVASYEPGIGSEENPFREIISYSNKMPLASAQYGAIEMPMLEGLYPSPGVGYSKVTVRSIHRKGTHGDTAVRSAIGKQVTEFYTARDYPTYSTFTPIAGMDYHFNNFFSILNKQITDRKVLSQGFLVETNDMHGKMKSQTAYSESDEKTPLSYSLHTYKNTGKNGLNDKVDFVYNDLGGAVAKGNMGIDMELMTDVREFKTLTKSFNGQIQTDFFTFVPFPFFLIPMLPIRTNTENKYRAVTCTKLINYHAIEDSVVVMDKGSVVSTKTIAYDAETGTAIVTQTANEFNDPIYNVNYPAYWAYSGMSPAYKNISRKFSGIDFIDGKIQNLTGLNNFFESGDELYLTDPGNTNINGCVPATPVRLKLWALDKTKYAPEQFSVNSGPVLLSANATDTKSSLEFSRPALAMTDDNLVFIDSMGKLFTRSVVAFTILRSGKRNLLNNSVASITTMALPINNGQLIVDTATITSGKVVAASAVVYKDLWKIDNEIIKKLRIDYTPVTCVSTETVDCGGYLEKSINPYVKGILGDFRPYKNMVHYNGRAENNTSANTTNIRTNGYITWFKPYWYFNAYNILSEDYSNFSWVWNSQSLKFNSKGLELESIDALNVFTSAQYGFNKTQTVAVSKNSRIREMFGESFEDYDYNESVNDTSINRCAIRHIDFSNIGTTQIVNIDTLGINAHSGKRMLRVNGGNTLIKNLLSISTDFDSVIMNMNRDTVKGLNLTGCNTQKFSSTPAVPDGPPTFGCGNMSFSQQYNGHGPMTTVGSTQKFYYGYTNDQYTQVTIPGNYSFTLNASQSFDNVWNPAPILLNRTAISVDIYSIDGTYIKGQSLYSDIASTSSFSVFLTCGIYKVTSFVSADLSLSGTNPTLHFFNSNASYSSTLNTISYRSPYPANLCFFTKPIRATDSVINPVFTLTKGKKMILSAWVRESCSATPCTKLNYAENKVELDFGGAGAMVTLKPMGTIIEGWQKIDGEFTVPPTATAMTMRLVNSGTAASYWDDIRIHPFNANMKTYTYDPRTLRLAAELDENNYASFYEYDEEGQLVRVKKETAQGIKTINETRAFKQKGITTLQ